MSETDPNKCPNCCDCTVPRTLEQSAARYNDQSATTLLAAQQNMLFQQQQSWMKAMEQQHIQSFANSQMLLRSIGAFQ